MDIWHQRLIRLLAWRSRHQAVRWIGTVILYFAALAIRYNVGSVYGAVPAVAFYPAILIAFVLFGWRQCLALLLAFVITGVLLFLPPNTYLLPIGWTIVGSCNIAILAGLEQLLTALVRAHERQRLMFREMQHRTANTLQAASAKLRVARMQVDSDAAAAAQLLEDAADRIDASATVHRRLNDPSLFGRGLAPVLTDVVSSIIDVEQVDLTVEADDLPLSFNQMSVITMLVIELANNAQKHVFQPGLGTKFVVTLRHSTDDRATLVVRDNGPGPGQTAGDSPWENGLGQDIVHGLVEQLNGQLSTTPGCGTEFVVQFPLGRSKR